MFMKEVRYYYFEDLPSVNNYYLQFVNRRKLNRFYHSHDFYEIVIFLNGSAKQLVNGCEYQFNKGDAICLSPKDKHMFVSQSENISILSLSIKTEEFINAAAVFGYTLDKNKYAEQVDCSDKLNEIYRYLLACLNSNEVNDYKILLCLIISSLTGRKQTNNCKELELTFEEMHNPQNMKDGIEAMMRISGYSRSQLYRILKRHIGISVNEYLTDLRLNTANKYIVYTDKSLEDIAEMVGYKSFSHFNKLFKNKFGISPAQLRKTGPIDTI